MWLKLQLTRFSCRIWIKVRLVMFLSVIRGGLSSLKGLIQSNMFRCSKNHGASAGASMSHSHSQILSLPIVPPSVSIHLDSMKGYFNQTGKCNLCEVHSKDLLINETSHFISIAPFAASFPFETWIIPQDHSSHFDELDNEKVTPFSFLESCTLGFTYVLFGCTLHHKFHFPCLIW
ncbi:hypothetical protein REPUB_Repub06bG0028500 [Reevesia pubescens]